MTTPVPRAQLAHVAALADRGVAVVIATRDSALRPCIARAWAPQIGAAAGARLCVEAPAFSRTRENLEPGREIAVTLSQPSTYRSAQLKGSVAGIGELTDDDRARVEEHLTAFASDLELVGLSARHAGRILNRKALVSVTLNVDEIYDQTPGASAGARL